MAQASGGDAQSEAMSSMMMPMLVLLLVMMVLMFVPGLRVLMADSAGLAIEPL